MADGKMAEIPGLAEFQAKLARLGAEVAADALETAGLAGMLIVQNAAKEKAPKRTRNLGRSIHMETETKEAHLVEIVAGTDLEYAAMQEFGGTVVPKNVKFLAIPLTSAARQYVSPRDFPGKLSPRISGEGGVLVDENGEAQYALAKRAVIPAHPYMRPALDENESVVIEEVGQALGKVIERLATA